MAVEIKGTPKEIAALVLELQGRQEESSMEAIERIIAAMPSIEINTPRTSCLSAKIEKDQDIS